MTVDDGRMPVEAKEAVVGVEAAPGLLLVGVDELVQSRILGQL